MRILLPILLPALLLSGCASLKPATFSAFRQQGDFAGATHHCDDVRKLAGKKVALEEVAYQTLRFVPPAGGDIALMEWADMPCADTWLAFTGPGKATRETAVAEINKLGVKVSEPWAWVHGLGVVYRSDEKNWAGVFDPASGRVGIARNHLSIDHGFGRPGLIATLAQLDRGISDALAAGRPDYASAMLVHREDWFGPAPALAARVAEKKSAPVSAPAKSRYASVPSAANPLETWQSTFATLRTATSDAAIQLSAELAPRHAAAVAHLQAQIAASAQRNAPATTAALHLQLSALLNEDSTGEHRVAARELLKGWLAGVLVAAPVPGGSAAVTLDWKIPVTNSVIASSEDALRLVPAASVTLGEVEAVGVGMSTGTGSVSISVPDPNAQALAAKRSAKQAEIDAAKTALADAQKRLDALKRAADSGSSGGPTPYGRTDRSYNNKPGGDVYKDTYNTTVYRSNLGSTVTPEMRLVDMEVSSAENTIRIRSQELASLPEPESMSHMQSFPSEEQQWRGKVRRLVTLTLDGFTTTVPAEIDLGSYRYQRHPRQGSAAARDDWKTQEQVIALASAELERSIGTLWPRVLRDATLARIAANAGNDGSEAQWGRHFFGETTPQTIQQLQLASLPAAQKLRATREARGTSNVIATLHKPAGNSSESCHAAPVMSSDTRLVSWCGALFDADSGDQLFKFMSKNIADARFSADGKRLALYDDWKSKVIVWSTPDGKPLSERDGKSISNHDVGPASPEPASRTLTYNKYADTVVITDKNWVRPKTGDYLFTFASGAAEGNNVRIDKGSLDGIRKGQSATVLSKYVSGIDASRWKVKEVTERSALLEGDGFPSHHTGFATEKVTALVRGLDLVW
jgi:hypothetical protein